MKFDCSIVKLSGVVGVSMVTLWGFLWLHCGGFYGYIVVLGSYVVYMCLMFYKLYC